MDKRHEETKGTKGWLHETRRSILWILYLNDADWGGENSVSNGGDGGELQAYCQRSRATCGANKGDLQVGWVLASDSVDDNKIVEYDPVFLDSWVQQKVQTTEDGSNDDGSDDDSQQWRPLSALYCMQDDGQ